jgi:flavin reductase (DIM6/NTAB) family NADH-FMN oxidoreductase RutF
MRSESLTEVDHRTDVLADRFRSAFRGHAAGVTVVAAATPDGPVGVTVSSVASVSVAPPILSFSLTRSSTSSLALLRSGRLTVHALAADQTDVATAFADRDGRRFTAEQGWTLASDGTPLLAGATATLHGRIIQVVPAGGSWVVLLGVDDVSRPRTGAAPLIHHDRTYWGPGPIPGPSPRPEGHH